MFNLSLEDISSHFMKSHSPHESQSYHPCCVDEFTALERTVFNHTCFCVVWFDMVSISSLKCSQPTSKLSGDVTLVKEKDIKRYSKSESVSRDAKPDK